MKMRPACIISYLLNLQLPIEEETGFQQYMQTEVAAGGGLESDAPGLLRVLQPIHPSHKRLMQSVEYVCFQVGVCWQRSSCRQARFLPCSFNHSVP